MKFQLTLLLSILGLISASCSMQENSNTKEQATELTKIHIKGTVQNSNDGKIKLYHRDEVTGEKIDLAEVEPDSTGQFATQFEVPETHFATLSFGRNGIVLYMEAGDTLQFTVDGADFINTLSFEGDKSAENNYLVKKTQALIAFHKNEQQSLFSLPVNEFQPQADSIENAWKNVFEQAKTKQKFTGSFTNHEAIELSSYWVAFKARYPMYYNYYAGQGNPDFEEQVLSEDYYTFFQALPLNNPQALASAEFKKALDSYVGYKFEQQLSEDEKSNLKWEDQVTQTYAFVKKEQLDSSVMAFVLAKNLSNRINYFGTESVEEDLNDFKNVFGQSAYLPSVNSVYEKWLKLAKGQVAPGFAYKDIDGNEIALSDFKGKVVYVDVWATWCGPCRGEIPHAKKLKEHYKGNEDVIFLYVSVDTDIQAWEKMLANDKDFADAVHVVSESGWDTKVTKDYMIKGIPRYILVDRNGNIGNAQAPRPSSGEEIIAAIDDLLAQESVSMN
ncbi:TlpA disulfide reductase family protein [Rapidithrix thailandica]|uniref:TlpA disulfide reductase family protein n=1 Tax=Rapidithrix thailandica TaxID=413964 RepID=A0AAW9RZD1_9BACT